MEFNRDVYLQNTASMSWDKQQLIRGLANMTMSGSTIDLGAQLFVQLGRIPVSATHPDSFIGVTYDIESGIATKVILIIPVPGIMTIDKYAQLYPDYQDFLDGNYSATMP